MSVPTATTGFVPITITSRGVMSDPPPMPVRPTSTPTPRPKTMTRGSMGRTGRLGGVQAALDLVGAGPPPLARIPRPRARLAADRGVAPVVQRVVGEVVLEDVVPDVA